MHIYRIYVKVTWHDRELLNSYYLVSAPSIKEARKKTREMARQDVAPTPKAKLSIRTSFKKFIK